MIDAHCHIDLYPDPSSVAEQCSEQGIEGIAVTTTPSAWRISSAIVKRHCTLEPALGLHPQVAHERHGELEIFEQRLTETSFVGEIGLDGAPEFRSGWRTQQRVFQRILQSCARAGGKILSIHSRRATSAVLDALEEYPDAGTAILHWFSGTSAELDRAIRLGLWFSVGPAMLASKKGQYLTERMPIDRLLTETDGPFARSGAHPLMPWDVKNAVVSIAQAKNRSASVIKSQIGQNFRELISSEYAI